MLEIRLKRFEEEMSIITDTIVDCSKGKCDVSKIAETRQLVSEREYDPIEALMCYSMNNRIRNEREMAKPLDLRIEYAFMFCLGSIVSIDPIMHSITKDDNNTKTFSKYTIIKRDTDVYSIGYEYISDFCSDILGVQLDYNILENSDDYMIKLIFDKYRIINKDFKIGFAIPTVVLNKLDSRVHYEFNNDTDVFLDKEIYTKKIVESVKKIISYKFKESAGKPISITFNDMKKYLGNVIPYYILECVGGKDGLFETVDVKNQEFVKNSNFLINLSKLI